MKNIDPQWIVEQYNVHKRSFKSIGDELGVFANTIRRIAVANGVIPRTKSDAHATAIKEGRAKHPTQGRKRSQSEKDKIAIGLMKKWENISETEKTRRSDIAKENWKNRSEEEKEKFNSASNKAIHKSSKDGSKLEKFIYEYLTKNKIYVEYHKENLIGNHKLHLDLFLPEYLTVIEIDGPSHFLPIWGADALLRTQKSDTEKNGLILSVGFVIIRIKQITKIISKIRMKLMAENILARLEEINKNFPPLNQRIIEIEL